MGPPTRCASNTAAIISTMSRQSSAEHLVRGIFHGFQQVGDAGDVTSLIRAIGSGARFADAGRRDRLPLFAGSA